MTVDASFLREQAQRCVRLARACPDQATSHELEAMGIDLMEKAAQVDELLRMRAEPMKDRANDR